jgi:hypothetical protein
LSVALDKIFKQVKKNVKRDYSRNIGDRR